MSDVNANIGINFDTSQALAQLRQLQAGLSRFNQTLTQGNVAAMQAQKGLNSQLIQAINATGKFVATQKDVATSTSSFTQSLEKNQMSMRQYFRYTSAAATMNTKVFKNMFAQERETLTRASKDRVKLLQSQYIQMQAANGDMIKVLQVIPKHLKMVNGQYADYATRMQMAAQRQQFLNKLLSQGSTQLLNFGKNTQWAGRQLMVGLTIPLSILGSTAAKTFMEMEQAVIKFTRVYGDMLTSGDATDKAIADIQRLGKEFTKYGIAVKDTVEMAASAAAMGLTGEALNAQVIQATRLSVLGQVEQQQALETTISLQNAFGISAEQLAQKINYLNAVENQTVLSIEDLTIAIPKAGPVVKQLGGSVEDLAFFMTAMKEGGINASEGANALKSGLASMINPSKKASEFLAGLGINIKGLVDANKGDLKGTIVGFARALDTLDPLNRARAIEQMFGKFQFARLSTLFQNVSKDGSQASRALGLAGASIEELAILSERELGKVENATGVKFKKSMEDLKLQLIPIGKAFLQAVTPIVSFVGRVLEKFNTLSDGTKKVITVIIGVIGGLAPIALMTFGILMNGLANSIKLFAKIRGGIAKLNGSNNVLGGGFDYLTNQQIENLAQSNALHTSHSQLISTFNVEAASVQALASAYATAASQARALAQSSPGLFNTVPGPAGAVAGLPKKFATGGVVPGTGNKDTVPAMLTPGEVVLSKDMVKENPELIAGIMNGSVKKYSQSTNIEGGGFSTEALKARAEQMKAVYMGTGSEGFDTRVEGLIDGAISAGTAGVKRIIEFARASGEEIVESQTEAMNRWRSAMLDEADAALAAVPDRSANKQEIKEFLKSRALGSSNAFDTLDTHGNQNGAKTFAHTETSSEVPYSQALQLTSENPAVADRVKLIQAGADWMNNLPDSDPRKPATPVTPKFRPVSAAGIEGISMGLNKKLDTGTASVDAFITEFTNLDPIEKWRTSLENAGLDVDQHAEGIRQLDAVYEERLRDFASKNKTGKMSDSDLTTIREEALSDPRVDPTVAAAARRSSNNVSGIRSSGVGKEQQDIIMEAYANGEIPLPDGVTSVPDVVFPKSGSAIGGEAGRGRRLGVFDQEVEDTLAPLVVATPEAEADAEAEGEKIGKAATRGVKKGAKTQSPSTDGIEVGKDIAEGVVIGLQEGEASVASQGAQLGSSAVPKKPRTAAETQARVDKMDLDNKAFYSDLDTPEFREQRQILKSQDRHRRKMGATGTVGGGPVTPPAPGPSSLTVASTARTEAAAEQLAVSTEQAATAQSQVVQQIHDESKSRVTIKGNTVNIQKAREEADKAENEAAITRARAAALENEQAKQKRTGSPTTITDEQVLAAKEKANAAEIEYARIRQELAEQGITAAQPGEMQEIATQDPVKTPAKVKKAEQLISNGTVEQGDGLRRIVDGTEDTADSTLLVADQTDELASITGEAVDAQTQTAGNLLTGAQITDATTGNLNDVLQSTDLTGLAQDDIADSSENIAEYNRQIEERKRIENEIGKKRLAALMAEKDGIIPEGTQSDSKYIDPEKAYDIERAQDEFFGRDPGTNGPDDKGQIGYTKNKKGEVLFDPETGEPTTLTQKQITKKKRGMRQEKVSKFSGKISGGLGTAAMVAGMVGAPPQVTAALGTAATVAQFAPMIAGAGPIGLAVGAVVALGAGAYMLNKHFNQMAAKAAQFAKDLSATREGLKSIGEMSGKVGASEIMDKRRSTSQYGKYDESIKIDNTFGNKFLGSDVGKKEKKLFQDNAKKFGNQKAVDDLSLKLATAVADGVLDAQQANSIAAELALQLKDQKIEMQVVGQISAMIGPDGKNLKDKPLETRALIMANANDRVVRTEEDINSGIGNTRENVAAVAAYNMNNIELASMMADQVQVEYETQKKKLEAELASTTNAAKKLEIGQKISALEASNLENQMLMNSQLLVQIGLQQKSFDKVYSASRWGSQAGKEDAYFDGTRSQLETTYKGTDQEEASKTFLNTTESFESADFSSGADQKTIQSFQAKIEMLVGSKVLSPSEANNYLELFSGQLDKFDILFDASVQFHGPAKTKELLNMFAGYSDKAKATAMVTEISLTKTNPGEFDAIMETLKGMQALDGSTISMEVLLTSIGLPGLELLKGQMEEIEKLKEASAKKGDKAMDLDAVSGLSPINEALVRELKANETRMSEFKDLSLEGQAEYLQKLQTQYANELVMTDTEKVLQAEKFARQQAMMAQAAKLIDMGQAAFDTAVEGFKADYLAMSPEEAAIAKLKPITATTVPSKTAGPGAGATDKGKSDDPLAFLDELAMRIKMVRDQAFNAKKPLESMMKALTSKKAMKDVSAMFDMFDGLQQRLISLKIPKEFRDYIAGLSAEDFEELQKADLAAKKKGQQGIFKYAAKKDKTGKVIKDKKGNIQYDLKNIVGISKEFEPAIKAYKEAPLNDFNIAQKEVIENTDNQFKAFNKLKAASADLKLGTLDTATALEALSNTALAASIASGQIKGPDLEEFIKDLMNASAAAEKYAVISDLLKKNSEFEFKSVAVPKLAAALKETGMSVDNIQTVLSDPALAKQLVKDLEDGKIDSKAIADYLKNIKDEKIIEIRAKFNAGDFASSAAPGMELVNKMFTVQEQLIRTGVNASSKALVENVKKLKEVNEKFQLEIQRITLEKIKPIEKAIEKAQRNIEINITRKIEDYQEQINDLQRTIEIAFERPIAAITAENTILSNDMEIMSHAAEEINKRYDEQAEALQKISDVKSQILEQEKQQLDLADALSKGDIAAAARAVQAIRAAQAARNAENASKALELSRKNEIDSLRGRDSGLSKEQITERQYQNAQAIYDLENRATTDVNGKLMTRLEILDQIKNKNDEIYNLEEKREAAQLAIRNQEDEIYKIRQLEIVPLEDAMEKNNYMIARDEYAIEQMVRGITVLGKTKDYWDGISAKIEASTLKGADFDRLMGSMLASVEEIEKGWGDIEAAFKKYSSADAAGPGTDLANFKKTLAEELALNEKIAKEKAQAAKDAIAAAEAEYKIKKEMYDAELKAIKDAEASKNWWFANFLQQAFNQKWKDGAPKAPVSGPTSAADDANTNYNDLTQNAANDMYAAGNYKGPTTTDFGGGSGSTSTIPGPGGNSAGGGTSGGGTSGNTDPGNTDPGKTDPPVVPPVVTPPVDPTLSLPKLKPATDAMNDQISDVGDAEQQAINVANDYYNLSQMIQKNYPGIGGLKGATSSRAQVVEANQKFLEKLDDSQKPYGKILLDRLLGLKDYRDMFEVRTEKDGKKTAVSRMNSSSDGYKRAVREAKRLLPQDLIKVLETIKTINSSFLGDHALMTKARSAYVTARKEEGYNHKPIDDKFWGINEIKDSNPNAYAKLKPLYDSYMAQKKIMDEKAKQGARARALIKGAGYDPNDLKFYFGEGENLADNNGTGSLYNEKADYTTWKGYATGGLVSSKFAQKKFSMGTDTVPAMLTPGEFVMNKFAVQTHGVGKMQAMNNGKSAGDSVYNYSISVNVKSESNPDEIARTVIAQIKSVDAQKIRGVRI